MSRTRSSCGMRSRYSRAKTRTAGPYTSGLDRREIHGVNEVSRRPSWSAGTSGRSRNRRCRHGSTSPSPGRWCPSDPSPSRDSAWSRCRRCASCEIRSASSPSRYVASSNRCRTACYSTRRTSPNASPSRSPTNSCASCCRCPRPWKPPPVTYVCAVFSCHDMTWMRSGRSRTDSSGRFPARDEVAVLAAGVHPHRTPRGAPRRSRSRRSAC